MPTDIEEAVARGHQASNLFPMLGDAELWDLAEDIGKRGLLEPIVIHEGQILDGRNRWVACMRSGRTPRTALWDGEGGSPTAYVISKNLKRRHLEPGQRAAIAAEALPLFEAEAKERERQGRERIPYPEQAGKATEHAGEMFAVNPRYVQDAKHLKEEAPEVFERIKAGGLTIPEAKREVSGFVMPEREQASPEERAYYALTRQSLVVSLDPEQVAGFCADAGLALEGFEALAAWLARFNAALRARTGAPLHVVR